MHGRRGRVRGLARFVQQQRVSLRCTFLCQELRLLLVQQTLFKLRLNLLPQLTKQCTNSSDNQKKQRVHSFLIHIYGFSKGINLEIQEESKEETDLEFFYPYLCFGKYKLKRQSNEATNLVLSITLT